MEKCGIIGAGAWGTAISTILQSNRIYIWSRNKKTVNSINRKKTNNYLKGIKLSKNLTIPSNINSLVEKGEIGMLMLKLVEIIGSDDIENLDPETLYFIVNVLNKAKIKKVRNQILNLALPLRV